MSGAGDGGPSAQVLEFAVGHLRSPAELDLLVEAHRSGRACSTDELARSTGLGRTHAQLCIDALIAAGVLTSSAGMHRVADRVADEAAAIAAVADRFRVRLVRSIMDAWTDG